MQETVCVSDLTFKSVTHLELILVCCSRYRANFIHLHVDISFSQHHLLKCFLFSSLWLWYLCQILSSCSYMYICSPFRFVTRVYFCGRTKLFVLLWLCDLSWDLENNSSSIVLFCSNVFGTIWLSFLFL